MAENLQVELAKLDDIGLSYIVGGRPDQIRVEPIPEKLSLYGITLTQLVNKVRQANRSFLAGRVREKGQSLAVAAGQTLQGIPDVGLLLLTARDGRPVYVRDVANIVVGAKPLESQAWNYMKAADGKLTRTPAVTVALAKRAGANAVVVSENITERLAELKGTLVPDDVDVIVTRNYGETANDKANELLFHLGLATLSIVVLVGLAIGWREGGVVLVVIPTTILLTLCASWLLGYTINRVSLFALIFSIGILVDDAIVVIENIARHWAMHDGRSRVAGRDRRRGRGRQPDDLCHADGGGRAAADAVRVGADGPLHEPHSGERVGRDDPVVLRRGDDHAVADAAVRRQSRHPRRGRARRLARAHVCRGGAPRDRDAFRRARLPAAGRRRHARLAFAVRHQVGHGEAAPVRRQVGAAGRRRPAEGREPGGDASARSMRQPNGSPTLPELASIQAYAGTAAPFNFNGLVRHYYLRDEPQQGDLQVNLAPKGERSRTSHEIALDVRARLKGLPAPEGTTSRSSRCRRGRRSSQRCWPRSTAPTPPQRRAVADQVRAIFRSVPFIVDDDVSFREQAPRLRFEIDQDNLEFHKVEEQDVYDTIAAYLGGTPVGYSHKGGGRYPVEIAVQLPKNDLAITEQTLSTPVPANALPGSTRIVELGDVVRVTHEKASYPIFRHNGRAAEMVMGELAGQYEAPIYGMLAVADPIDKHDWGGSAQAGDQPARPALERSEARAAVGRRMGGDVRDLPRHGRGVHGRACSASTCWWWRSSAPSRCRSSS